MIGAERAPIEKRSLARSCWILGTLAILAGAPGCRENPGGRGAPAASASIAGSASARRPPPPPPSAEELAILAPIARGSDLAGFEVREIHGVRDGVLRIVCTKKDSLVRLDIALTDDEGPVPPATAGKYAVFYTAKSTLPDDAAKLAQQLAKVLEGHQDLPPPKGMTKFVEKQKPGTAL
ncbi:MAG: hypothetical protein QM820_45865 [Minicystis sp.]